jgi:hypothetical protein
VKAISLWQPWASLWCSNAKVHETRHWRVAVPKTGVWLAVHAARRFEREGLGLALYEVLDRTFGADWARTLPAGAIVGAVHVTGCYRTEDVVCCYGGWGGSGQQAWMDDLACGNFAAGRFAWKREAFRVLPEPVPWRGRQSLFDVPDEVLAPVLGEAVA